MRRENAGCAYNIITRSRGKFGKSAVGFAGSAVESEKSAAEFQESAAEFLESTAVFPSIAAGLGECAAELAESPVPPLRLDAFRKPFAVGEAPSAQFHVFYAHGAFGFDVQFVQLAVVPVDFDAGHPFVAVPADAQLAFAVGSERDADLVLPYGSHLVAVCQPALQGIEFFFYAGVLLIVVPIDVNGALCVDFAVRGVHVVADNVLVDAPRDVEQALCQCRFRHYPNEECGDDGCRLCKKG